MWWKTIPDPFLKNQDWIYLWINSLKFYVFCFYCMLSWRLSKLLEPSCIVLAFISHKAFLKTKVWNWGLELVSAIWKSRHRHLGISIGIDVGIGIGIAKKFCLANSLFLPFEVLYEENIYSGVLFKYVCWPSWEFQTMFRAVIL